MVNAMPVRAQQQNIGLAQNVKIVLSVLSARTALINVTLASIFPEACASHVKVINSRTRSEIGHHANRVRPMQHVLEAVSPAKLGLFEAVTVVFQMALILLRQMVMSPVIHLPVIADAVPRLIVL